jgi:hypothetical protein
MYILILYALCVAIILFGIYHYFNFKNELEEYPDKKYEIFKDLLNVNNIIIFVIIFAFSLTLMYFSFDEKSDILSMIGITDNEYSKLNNISKTTLIDPNILKNTTEPMSAGFEPYNSSGGSMGEESSDDNSSATSNDSD